MRINAKQSLRGNTSAATMPRATELTAESTHGQVPTAKSVFDYINGLNWLKKLTSSLITRDLRVGGDIDEETGKWSPDAGAGKSRLAVSGTLELHGEVKAENSSFKTHHMNVGGEMKVAGDSTLDGTVRVNDSLKVKSELEVGGRLKIKNSSTLDVGGGDVKNVKSLEVDGTAKLLNDVQIKNNTNRDYTVKLSDVLNEALDYGFKGRVYVDKMDGATFYERLTNAYAVVDDGGTICVPSGEYTLEEQTSLNKSVRIVGVGKERPIIHFKGGPFAIKSGCVNLCLENLVMSDTDVSASDSSPLIQAVDKMGVPVENIKIINCHLKTIKPCIYTSVITSAATIDIRNSVLESNTYNIQTTTISKLTITNSRLFSFGAKHQNIHTAARSLYLEDCNFTGKYAVVAPRYAAMKIVMLDCAVNINDQVVLCVESDYKYVASAVTIGGNTGFTAKRPDSPDNSLSKVLTEADIDTIVAAVTAQMAAQTASTEETT